MTPVWLIILYCRLLKMNFEEWLIVLWECLITNHYYIEGRKLYIFHASVPAGIVTSNM